MLQDTFEREMQFRARDTALGIREIGIMKEGEIWMLAAEDPVHGTAAHKAMMAGNHAEAARSLMAMADKMEPEDRRRQHQVPAGCERAGVGQPGAARSQLHR